MSTVEEALTPVTDWLHDVYDDRQLAEASAAKITAAALPAAGNTNLGRPSQIVLEPGDGTRYDLILTPVFGVEWPGNLLLSSPDRNKCLLVSTGGTYHVPYYVHEKLGGNKITATVIAAFLTILDAALTDAAVVGAR